MSMRHQAKTCAAVAALLSLNACVTNAPKPEATSAHSGNTKAVAATSSGSACERLPTMSNKQKVQAGAVAGAALGLVATSLSKGHKTKHFATGALGGALVGALAGSAFKNEIDVEEQPDGTVKLKIPGALMFASGQYALSPAFQSTLSNVTRTISKYCDISVRVVGHTDNVGAPAANQQLSENRARAVQQHMGTQGFDQARIRIEGKGALEPIANNIDDNGRQQNRRVEIFVRPPNT